MDIMFAIFPILFGVVFLIIVIGMIVHMIMFGTIFGIIAKRVTDAAKHESELQVAMLPKPCSYCGVTIPPGAEQCPGCGAKS